MSSVIDVSMLGVRVVAIDDGDYAAGLEINGVAIGHVRIPRLLGWIAMGTLDHLATATARMRDQVEERAKQSN